MMNAKFCINNLKELFKYYLKTNNLILKIVSEKNIVYREIVDLDVSIYTKALKKLGNRETYLSTEPVDDGTVTCENYEEAYEIFFSTETEKLRLEKEAHDFFDSPGVTSGSEDHHNKYIIGKLDKTIFFSRIIRRKDLELHVDPSKIEDFLLNMIIRHLNEFPYELVERSEILEVLYAE